MLSSLCATLPKNIKKLDCMSTKNFLCARAYIATVTVRVFEISNGFGELELAT